MLDSSGVGRISSDDLSGVRILWNGQNGVFCHHSFLVQEQLEVLPSSLLNDSVILQKCPILGLERNVAI